MELGVGLINIGAEPAVPHADDGIDGDHGDDGLCKRNENLIVIGAVDKGGFAELAGEACKIGAGQNNIPNAHGSRNNQSQTGVVEPQPIDQQEGRDHATTEIHGNQQIGN